jgi:hypothetical protein
MKIPGNGPSLIDATPWLRDPAERHRRILDVVERDSVIEGLPRFTAQTRAEILDRLQQLASAAPVPEPHE